MKKYIALIQARMNSSRLPGKVLKKVKNKNILEYVIERVKSSRCDDLIVCTSVNNADNAIEDFCSKNNIKFYRGDENDVLGRFYNALKNKKDSTAVRITADNPLVDPEIINYLLEIHKKNKNSVTTNYFSKTFPNGTIISLIDFNVLSYMNKEFKENNVREHIVFGFNKLPKKFKFESVEAPSKWNRPDIKFDVDYEEDIVILNRIADEFKITGKKPNTIEIIDFFDKNPEIKNLSHTLLKKWKTNSNNTYK